MRYSSRLTDHVTESRLHILPPATHPRTTPRSRNFIAPRSSHLPTRHAQTLIQERRKSKQFHSTNIHTRALRPRKPTSPVQTQPNITPRTHYKPEHQQQVQTQAPTPMQTQTLTQTLTHPNQAPQIPTQTTRLRDPMVHQIYRHKHIRFQAVARSRCARRRMRRMWGGWLTIIGRRLIILRGMGRGS